MLVEQISFTPSQDDDLNNSTASVSAAGPAHHQIASPPTTQFPARLQHTLPAHTDTDGASSAASASGQHVKREQRFHPSGEAYMPRRRWTFEEDEALKDGIARHGQGSWRYILDDTTINFKVGVCVCV